MATKKKNRDRKPWWLKPKNRLWLLASGGAVLLAAAAIWYAGGQGGQESSAKVFLEPAPPFSLPTISGEQFVSRDHIGQHALLLFFNEGIGCGACWDQIVDLEADWERFDVLGIQMVSVMVDPLDQLQLEAEDRGIRGVVASDVDKSVSNTYGAMDASMHPGVKPGHTFVLVNKSGKIVWRWDWPGHGKPMYLEVDKLYKEVSAWLKRAG